MRRLLDTLYTAAGLLAAVFMVGVLLCIGLSIVTRQMALHLPGLDAYTGYCMAAAGFLALAHTFKRGEHIRVTLLLASLRAKNSFRLDAFALIIGTIIAANIAWFSCKLVLDSHAFGDVSTGEDATPLWIPQVSMAVGTVIFFIALLDETISRLRGRPDRNAEETILHE